MDLRLDLNQLMAQSDVNPKQRGSSSMYSSDSKRNQGSLRKKGSTREQLDEQQVIKIVENFQNQTQAEIENIEQGKLDL